MLLKKIVINNFKGIKEKVIEFDEKSTAIVGKNGAGKTTVYDAFCWCLFNKDSQDKANFDIKNYDTDEKAETYVEVFHESGSFARKYYRKEKKETFQGIVTISLKPEYDYFVDGVSTPATKFNKKVSELVGEDTENFKILSNIYYFLSIMPWKKRREFLFSIFGKVSDEKILEMKEFKELLEYSGGKSIEDVKKVLMFEIKKTEEALKEIPIQITENEKNKSSVTEKEKDVAEKDIAELKNEINKHEKEISALSEKDKSVIESRIIELENEKQALYNNIQKENLEISAEFNEEKNKLSEKINLYSKQINDLEIKKNNIELANNQMKKKEEADKKELASLITERDGLRNKFFEVKERKFNPDEQICSCCGQKYPDEEIGKRKERFEDNIEKELEALKKRGSEINSKIDELSSLKYAYQDFDNKLIEDLKELKKEAEKQLSEINDKIKSSQKKADTTEIDNKISVERNKIKELESGNEEVKKELKEKIAVLKKQIEEKEEIIISFKQNLKFIKRSEEINKEEERLNEISQSLATWKNKIDLFEKKKCELNEKIVNDNFKTIKFKLFDIQINGGINLICEAMIDGSPFNSNLNTGARILAGIELIEVISEKLNIKLPVFVDNRESLTSEIESDLQIISLIASESEFKTNSKKEISL